MDDILEIPEGRAALSAVQMSLIMGLTILALIYAM